MTIQEEIKTLLQEEYEFFEDPAHEGYYNFKNKAGVVAGGPGGYGKMPAHKRIVYVNETYDKVGEWPIFLGIREDADSRNVFHGLAYSVTDIKFLLERVR